MYDMLCRTLETSDLALAEGLGCRSFLVALPLVYPFFEFRCWKYIYFLLLIYNYN